MFRGLVFLAQTIVFGEHPSEIYLSESPTEKMQCKRRSTEHPCGSSVVYTMDGSSLMGLINRNGSSCWVRQR